MLINESDLQRIDDTTPGLLACLSSHSLLAIEEDSSIGIEAFKKAGAPGLLVPEAHGGAGATALDALRFTVCLGSVAPSLAVAATMHNYAVASMRNFEAAFRGLDWAIMDAVAHEDLLVGSGGAEGRSGAGQLAPKTTARRRGDEWIVNGSKKPCSLSRSMDLFSASVLLIEPDRPERFGLIVVPRASEGIEIRSFWQSPVLRATESDEVVLKDVAISDQLVMKVDEGDHVTFRDVQHLGMTWFSLLVGAAYLGMADALTEMLFAREKGTSEQRSRVAGELKASFLALERVAISLETAPQPQILFDAITVRYAVQDAIQRAVTETIEILGGMQFVQDPAVSYLGAATRVIAFHPPTRGSMWAELDRAHRGELLAIV